MSSQEKRIIVAGGDLAVVDYGGDGQDVLLVHSVCHSLAVWDGVAAELGDCAHVVSVDLRGHGQSTADATDVTQIPSDIAHLVDALGLEQPVLVGHDVAGGFVAAVAAEHPQKVGGLVVIDSPVTEPREIVRDIVRTVGTEAVVDLLTERFGLGYTGTDALSMEAFIAEHAVRDMLDWLSAAPDESSMRALLRRAIRVSHDGSWVLRPTPTTVRHLTADPDGSTYQPGLELLADIHAPVTVVTLSEGRSGSVGQGLVDLASSRSNVRIAQIDCGPHVLFTNARDLTLAVLDTLSRVEQQSSKQTPPPSLQGISS